MKPVASATQSAQSMSLSTLILILVPKETPQFTGEIWLDMTESGKRSDLLKSLFGSSH
jgi:hypothetical protein